MNWPNYDKLTALLTALPPEQFDYMRNTPQVPGCGCVAYHIGRAFTGKSGYAGIMEFLEVPENEAKFLYGSRALIVTPVTPETEARRLAVMAAQWAGPLALAEALRRLAWVAEQHVRPLPTWQPDADKFLADIRLVGRQSVQSLVAALATTAD